MRLTKEQAIFGNCNVLHFDNHESRKRNFNMLNSTCKLMDDNLKTFCLESVLY